jgi:hypothetical protein
MYGELQNLDMAHGGVDNNVCITFATRRHAETVLLQCKRLFGEGSAAKWESLPAPPSPAVAEAPAAASGDDVMDD